ncbi:MAG: SagB/ThcOx family dehydrogenase [Anaerolineae bacterium]|nr:SagB/ThcOx family dehydrogenase [Anaerolineae bacterium]
MSIGREFMLKTRYAQMGPSDQSQGVPQPPLEKPVPLGATRLPLPEAAAAAPAPLSFLDLVTRRQTLRRYAPTPLSLAELAYLLWCTQGVKKVTPTNTRRTVPSAGARHAFETIVLANRVEGLAAGLYRYGALAHDLIVLGAPADIAAQVMAACLDQQQVVDSAVTFIWVADVYRMQWRYGERGYRYLHLDAGHVCQNLYLAAESIGCGVCAMAAFDDERLNNLLGLDGETEFVIYLASVGRREDT